MDYPCWVEWRKKVEIICPAWCPGVEKLVEAIGLLADQGVTAVEIGIGHPQYFDHGNGFELQKLMTELSKTGVRVHSIHSPFGPEYDLSSPDDAIHERGVDGLIQSIELASVIESGNVIVHASDLLPNGQSRRMDRARGVLREVSVVAKESGIMLALENLPPGYLGHTPEEIVGLLNGMDPEAIGVCYDSGHANLSGKFDEFTEALLPYSVTTHLHDNDGVTDQHRFPGQGTINWHRFAGIYHSTRCRASIMLECKLPENAVWSEAFHRFRSELGE